MVFGIFACCATAVAGMSPKIAVDTEISTAGYYRLSWSEPESNAGAVYILQEAISPEFNNPSISYKGPDLATVISGKPNGHYYYRVRRFETNELDGVHAEAPPHREVVWSDVVSVNVNHHSLSKAVGFFIAGFIVFAATLFMIVKGAAKSTD